MPPGKVLQPVLKMKVDELFLCWLSESSTQAMLRDCLRRIQMPAMPERGAGDAEQPGPWLAAAAPDPAWRPHECEGPGAPGPTPASTALPVGAASSARSGPPIRGPRRSGGARVVQTRKEEPLPPAASRSIPTFYFPRGRPQDTVNIDTVIAKIERTFAQFPHERATMEDMGRVAKVGVPVGTGGGPSSVVAGTELGFSESALCHPWGLRHRGLVLSSILAVGGHDSLRAVPGALEVLIAESVALDPPCGHPAVWCLQHLSQERGTVSLATPNAWLAAWAPSPLDGLFALRALESPLAVLWFVLQNVALLEEEADINQLTEFFSYEHFYVIYCKFWELDTDHDLLIDAQDLARHNDHAISTKMIDRIFSGAVTRGKKVQKEGKISYADFVWFLISEEDKKTPTSIEYWFRCMDLDGDGALSMFELEYFYEEQCRRLDSMAIEALPFEDCLCQMLDLVKPQREGRITLQDLKRCKLANVFFDTFFNIEKYLDHEQKEQVSLLRESESEGPELSDWERFAAEEYDILVAEEAAGDPWEDGYEAELSPVEQKLSALRSPLAQRPFLEAPGGLGAVELYEYEGGDDDLPPS
ncbi:serine/threonine-protein phosphatase 2A regulatory subunit B'' subunit beta-like [Cervus canadensis]|uniref:serine/threonine-protein phosphatase 2A regulatory subunit B'' subunit beta-like n=1 Tax=Cervus canadensis TaxID=1574408 RepID=UPI001CA33B00|nr:serine/threonine-protein phosphatase 2A regulatory subunit B'' subunit beta-like [Cervus canadensis]